MAYGFDEPPKQASDFKFDLVFTPFGKPATATELADNAKRAERMRQCSEDGGHEFDHYPIFVGAGRRCLLCGEYIFG